MGSLGRLKEDYAHGLIRSRVDDWDSGHARAFFSLILNNVDIKDICAHINLSCAFVY